MKYFVVNIILYVGKIDIVKYRTFQGKNPWRKKKRIAADFSWQKGFGSTWYFHSVSETWHILMGERLSHCSFSPRTKESGHQWTSKNRICCAQIWNAAACSSSFCCWEPLSKPQLRTNTLHTACHPTKTTIVCFWLFPQTKLIGSLCSTSWSGSPHHCLPEAINQ